LGRGEVRVGTREGEPSQRELSAREPRRLRREDTVGTPKTAISPALDAMFEAFRSWCYEASGIYFQDRNRDRLLHHVQVRMAATGVADPLKYLALLKASPPTRGERAAFFAQATVNETYFFREVDLLGVLRDRVLPQLFSERLKAKRRKVVIWSAACSSGEEAYTLAILISECLPVQTNFTSIVGFDISPDMVEKARRAEYGDYAVRFCSEQQKAAFFTRNGPLYVLKPEFRDLAAFQVGNLTDAAFLKALPKPDLILCRNVLIYFDKNSKAQVLGNLSQCLPPHGYLFLGQSETLFNVDHSLELVHFFKAFGYRLNGAKG
jgi:chemotaxis protein methyltransferase CheR